MTISQAKKILGKSGLNLTNKQIERIIQQFNSIIEIGFQQFEEKSRKKRGL